MARPNKKPTKKEEVTPVPDLSVEDWGTPEAPVPSGNGSQPSEAETSSWAEAVAELEEDAKWDGSNAPAGLGVAVSSKGVADNLAAVDLQDWGEAAATADADLNTLDTWEAGAAPNLTLNIHQHTGTFNSDTFKLLIYGETGTEKSRTASTFPNAIFADVDHGMSSVTEKVDVAWIDDNQNGFKQLTELYRFLANDQHDYETVVLDTLNEMQRVIMRFTVDEYTHIRRSYGNLPGQSDYGKMLYEFMELTRAFISLPMKVVLLAQVNSQQFETDSLGPQLIGKNTSRELQRKMDIIGYIYKAEAEEGTIPEITFDSPIHVTKDRSNRLPTALPRPSYGRMAAYWK
jgi:phage nucleotide-binding protein